MAFSDSSSNRSKPWANASASKSTFRQTRCGSDWMCSTSCRTHADFTRARAVAEQKEVPGLDLALDEAVQLVIGADAFQEEQERIVPHLLETPKQLAKKSIPPFAERPALTRS